MRSKRPTRQPRTATGPACPCPAVVVPPVAGATGAQPVRRGPKEPMGRECTCSPRRRMLTDPCPDNTCTDLGANLPAAIPVLASADPRPPHRCLRRKPLRPSGEWLEHPHRSHCRAPGARSSEPELGHCFQRHWATGSASMPGRGSSCLRQQLDRLVLVGRLPMPHQHQAGLPEPPALTPMASPVLPQVYNPPVTLLDGSAERKTRPSQVRACGHHMRVLGACVGGSGARAVAPQRAARV